MPTMANIVVKKNDNTTDITYTGVVPSAGDKTQAIWRSQTVGSAAAHQPEIRVTSRGNGPGSARRVDVQFSYPSTAVGSDGRVNVVERYNFQGSALVPLNMLTTDVNEAASQLANLIASALVKSCLKEGFAPT